MTTQDGTVANRIRCLHAHLVASTAPAAPTTALHSHCAVVTGAASGIGAASAALLAQHGARVVCADLDEAGAAAVARDIVAKLGREDAATAIAMDCASPASIAAAAAAALRWTGGRCDIVLNNAGVTGACPLDADDAAFEPVWERCLAVCVTSQVRLVRALLPALRRSRAGRVVNIASTEGSGATIFGAAYTAAKHASVGLTRAMAVELGSQGNITCNCIQPGPVRTGMTGPIPERQKRLFARRLVPLRRYGEPREIAQMVLSVCLPASSFVNGSVIAVDGGVLANNALLPWRLPWEAKAEAGDGGAADC